MNTRATTSRPHRKPSRGLWSVLSSAASLTLRVVEFGFYHLLQTTVDPVSRLPRNTTMPEAARLYRENIALKAQLDALEAELAQRTEPAPTPMATRAAQVFAYLLTRGDEPSSATSSRRRCAPSGAGRPASARCEGARPRAGDRRSTRRSSSSS